jgi:ribose 5-phosphate isomerase RpiB
MVRVFMETEFAGGRHAGRVEKLSQLDGSKEER